MRILLVTHGFPPAAMGGTEIYTHDLAQAFQTQFGDQVSVLTREADPDRKEYAVRREHRDGLEICFVNNTFASCRSFADTYRSPPIRAIAADFIDEVRPDIAHIQHLTCLSTELVLELAQRGIAILFTLNDYWLICHRGQLLDTEFEVCPGASAKCTGCIGNVAGVGPAAYRAAGMLRRVTKLLPSGAALRLGGAARALAGRLRRERLAASEGERRIRHMQWIAGKVDLFLAPSQTLRRHFLDFGIPPEKISHVRQGIDHTPFVDLKRVPGPAKDHLRIGFLGSLMVSKAPHLLIEAFAALPSGLASLEIYGGHAGYHGDDSYRDRVGPLLTAPGVNHHGTVPRSEVAKALAAMDVLVIPSVWLENAPFVIREAFLAGVPVIASGHGGMAEMVSHEENGLLFRPGDAASLAQALHRLIAEPGLLQQLRSGAAGTRQITIAEDAAGLRELYQGHLEDAPQRHPRLAAVVLNYRTAADTVLAVRSLTSSERPVDDIIVVDNASDDGSAAFLQQQLAGAEIISATANLGFSGGCNIGIRRALERGADAVFLLNADALVAGDTLGRLEQALAASPKAGIAAPIVLHRSDPSVIASAGMSFATLSGRMQHRLTGVAHDPVAPPPTRQVAGVDGCAMLIRSEVFAAVGLLDEDYFFSFEDLDFCLRSGRAGHTTICVGDAVAYHAGSLAIGPRSARRLYFATRNHLLAARRAAPLPLPLALPRSLLILSYNIAHAALCGWVPMGEGIRECLRGAWHHLRSRYGPAPPGSD